jgi:hypothetical protein
MYRATYAPEVYRRVHGLVHHEFRARKSANALTALAAYAVDHASGSLAAGGIMDLQPHGAGGYSTATATDQDGGVMKPRVVLYNPRAVFFTMPLALVALASALDRTQVDVVIIDGRLEADPVSAVVAASRGALCVGITVLTGAPIHDALAVSRAVKASDPWVHGGLGRLASVVVLRRLPRGPCRRYRRDRSGRGCLSPCYRSADRG